MPLHGIPGDGIRFASGTGRTASESRVPLSDSERPLGLGRFLLSQIQSAEIEPKRYAKANHPQGTEPHLIPCPIGRLLGGLRGAPLSAKIRASRVLGLGAWIVIFRGLDSPGGFGGRRRNRQNGRFFLLCGPLLFGGSAFLWA